MIGGPAGQGRAPFFSSVSSRRIATPFPKSGPIGKAGAYSENCSHQGLPGWRQAGFSPLGCLFVDAADQVNISDRPKH